MSNSDHWNKIFSDKNDQELGWYESDLSQTLKFLEHIAIHPGSKVFLPGAGTSDLVEELLKTDSHIVLNDISDSALKKLQARLGHGSFEFFHHDMGVAFTQKYDIDIWIDRAVLHFLLSEENILTYFNNVKDSIKVGGYVLLAEFSKSGASMCAGLNIHQYTVEEMQARLGSDFALITCEDFIFINPFAQERPYIYALFQRK